MNNLFTKFSAIFTTISLAAFAGVPLAFADTPTTLDPCKNGGLSEVSRNLCGLTGSNIGVTVRNVIVAVLVIAAVIALAFLIWGGIKWITSGGDKSKVEAARSTTIAAIIGLIIAFLAFFILSIVLGLFRLGLNNLTIPSITG